ncbi:MAG TPA: c-type cytochrome biogenesis protein CcmI, partial [Usitatibacteraceae bacterium]|nr:c-type cytochrome biogenesis protein CcmI [Usitatibacteraceae bacterium]
MIAFWIVSALLTVVAVAFVLVPLLRGRAATGPSVRDANLAALRSQRRELDADVAHGLLPAEARDEAVADLVSRGGFQVYEAIDG